MLRQALAKKKKKKRTKLRPIAKPSFDSKAIPFWKWVLGKSRAKEEMYVFAETFFLCVFYFNHGTSTTTQKNTHTQDLRAVEITIWTDVIAANSPSLSPFMFNVAVHQCTKTSNRSYCLSFPQLKPSRAFLLQTVGHTEWERSREPSVLVLGPSQ